MDEQQVQYRPGWYPVDGTGEQMLRWWDGSQWTEHIVVREGSTAEALPMVAAGANAGQVGPPSRRGRSRRLIVALAIVGFVAVGLTGLDLAMDELDTYTQDLTTDQDSWIVSDWGSWATSFERDGYHMLIREPNTWGISGLKSSTTHTVLSIEIELDALTAPPGSAVGPFCWESLTSGYGFFVDAEGAAQLVQVESPDGSMFEDHDARVLARTEAGAEMLPYERLMITCAISPLGSGVALGGYVDGLKVLEGESTNSAADFAFNGFAARTSGSAPGEWVVSTFERRGPDDMPDDAPVG